MEISRKTILTAVLATGLMGAGCVHIGDGGGDPRVGEMGKVKFVGGGSGCSSSTVMAVGSTETLDLESATQEDLPLDLVVDSTDPAIIEADAGETGAEVVLVAHDEGDSLVQLWSGSEVYDELGFSAEPAASVTFEAPEAVFAGTTLIMDVQEVYGSCGEDCPLIGSSFIQWSSSPAGSLELVSDVNRKALFAVGEVGDAGIVGDEPSLGTNLVDHPVTVLDLEDAGALDATLLVALPDDSILDPIEMPAEVPVGSLVLVQLTAEGPDGSPVPLTIHEAAWSVEGDAGVMVPHEIEDGPLPEGPVYSAEGAGEVTLVADVELMARTGRFDVTVVE